MDVWKYEIISRVEQDISFVRFVHTWDILYIYIYIYIYIIWRTLIGCLEVSIVPRALWEGSHAFLLEI